LRVLIVALAAVLIAGAAAFALRDRGGDGEAPPRTIDQMADDLGAPIMGLIDRGHVPGRSGEILMVPRPHHYVINREWDLSTLGSDTPTLISTHSNPWDYLTRVPIVLWGKSWIEAHVTNYDEVDIAGLGPTYARILGMSNFDAEGEVLPEALIEGAASRPKVIFTVVIDGGGWNTLKEHPNAWPAISGLMQEGTTYYNATIGSAPSITGALHATFGTGSYPQRHGIPGNLMRGNDGVPVDAYLQNADPRFLKIPTLSELWDEVNDNRAIIGTISYEGWHLGMIGHGAQREGGDKDFAALWELEEDRWFINEDYYTLPSFLRTTDLERLESYERALDPRDGVAEGAWFGHSLKELQQNTVRPGTPAFARFTGDAVAELLRSEPIGTDQVTDMIWVEMKMPDFAGHLWNVVSPEEEDVLAETDRQIGRFKKVLDRQVGAGNYVLAISADHGQQPLPDLLGGWRINSLELTRDIEAEFGPIVERITPVDIFVDRERVEEQDVDLADVAQFIAAYRLGDNVPEEVASVFVPEARRDDLLFAGAFPTGYLQGLSEEEIQSFGDSAYPEGVLVVEQGNS
jgi:hypothetical protein